MMFFRSIYFDIKYLIDEIWIKIQHPKRKCDIIRYVDSIIGTIIFHPWYCLKRGVVNLFRWFKIIWRLDVFDHLYLHDMMDKQLEQMEIFWKSDNPHVMGQKHIAKRIEWTRKLYKMHQDEHYIMEHYYQFHDEFNIPKDMETEVIKVDEFGIPVLYEVKNKFTPSQSKSYMDGSKKAWDMHDKVWKLYMKNLSKSRAWWD